MFKPPFLLLPSLTFLRTFLYPRSCTHGTRGVHEGEPPWRWRENSHQARVRLCLARRNKKRPSRKQVTAEHRVASITSSYYTLFSTSVIGAPNYTSICLERKIGDERTSRKGGSKLDVRGDPCVREELGLRRRRRCDDLSGDS